MAGEYARVSVPKKTDNAGRPAAPKSYIILIDAKDVLTYTRDAKGVLMTAFALKTGKKAIAVYATNTSVKVFDTTEGDKDAKGFVPNVEFEHPGDEQEIAEFKENNINTEFISIVVKADPNIMPKIAGAPGSTLSLNADSQDDKDAVKNIIKLKVDYRGPVIGRIPLNMIPETDNAEINEILGLTSGGL